MDNQLNKAIHRVNNFHGINWYELPDGHPDKQYIQALSKNIKWDKPRRAFKDLKGWTREEIKYVEMNKHKNTVEQMAKELGRPVESINQQLAKLKIKKNNRRKDFKK